MPCEAFPNGPGFRKACVLTEIDRLIRLAILYSIKEV